MRASTAIYILRKLAREGVMTTRSCTFIVPPYPEIVAGEDVYEAIWALAESLGYKKKDVRVFSKQGIIVWVSPKLFERLYKRIFVEEKLPHIPEGIRSRMTDEPSPLPSLFIGREKTQIRQIPLTDRPPWPFHFLLELGGMVVLKPNNPRDMLLALKQFLNNHPQFEIRVEAKECPDGSIAIFTYWFKELNIAYRKENVNVPS